MTNLIPLDFHCHSTHSDGAYTINKLLDLAKANGCKYLALTDHDTISGITEAKRYAAEINITLISGVEISVTWGETSVIHIIGLNINENDQNLLNNLEKLRSQRFNRGKKIARVLEKIGIPNALAGAMKYCHSPEALSRTHFSRFLVDHGYVKPGQAFDTYLGYGKPGYVAQTWAKLEDCVSWITESGGIAVIAHPCRYALSQAKLLQLIHDFKKAGGRGIEVISPSHSRSESRKIAVIANEHGLLCSLGSDFHDTSHKSVLGVNPILPLLNCKPVYNEFNIMEQDLI